MFRNHRARVTALVALVALAVLAGCGGNEAATDQEAVSETTAPANIDTKDVVPGGDVVVGVEAGPASIDFVGGNGGPADSATAYATSMIYEGLTTLGPDGVAQNSLAESVEHNDDFTVWTAKLRDGVTFTDGTPLDAAAVVDSFRFRADPASCPCASAYEGITVEAVDPMTVQFTLDSPRARFAETRMSDPIAAPSTLEAGVDRNKTPVGTGPFRLVDRDSLQFERNEQYWRKDDNGRALPYVDKVRLAPIADPSVRLAAIRKGEIQAMEVTDGPTLNAVKDDAEFTVLPSARGGTTVVVANTRTGPTADQEVRDALALAVDRDALAQSYAQASSVPAYSFFSDDFAFPMKSSFPKRDVAKAKELVESIKTRLGPDALKLNIVCAKIPEAEALLPVAVNQIREVGFDATLTFLDVGEYASQVLGGGSGWDLACSRTASLDANPAELGGFLTTGSAANVAKYSNPEVDALFEKERSAVDFDERTEIFQEIGDIVVNDKPYVPLLFNQVGAVARKNLQGVQTPNAVWPTMVALDRIWLKES